MLLNIYLFSEWHYKLIILQAPIISGKDHMHFSRNGPKNCECPFNIMKKWQQILADTEPNFIRRQKAKHCI